MGVQPVYPCHPDWFKALPKVNDKTPQWAMVMYSDCENFIRITTLYQEYFKLHPFEKNIHTQNFKHWYKQVVDYVDDNGMVNKPMEHELVRQYAPEESINNSGRNSSSTWSNIGPNRTYKSSGNSQHSLHQANIYCIGLAPSNDSILYASTETGSLFKSINKGHEWTPIARNYAFGAARDLKVDPFDENTVYMAMGSAIYKTTNGGSTWTEIYIAGSTVEQFYLHSTNSQIVYAATNTNLLKSTNGGITWNSSFSGYVFDIEAMPGTNDTLFISVKNDVSKRPEIYKSVDGGANWALKDNGYYVPSDLNVAQVFGCKIGVSPANPNRVYAGIIADGKAGDQGWIGVYYSNDGGETWQEDSGFDGGPYAPGNDVDSNWYVAGYSSGYHQGWYNFDLDVSHNDADKFWVGTIWFCESANKGGNFDYIRGSRSLDMHADIQDIDISGNDIWICSDGGINYSNDECQTTEIRMNGITSTHMWGFAQGWNEDVWVGGRYHNGDVAWHENYGEGNSIFLGGAESATGYINPMFNKRSHFSDIGDKLLPDSLHEPSQGIPNLDRYPTQSYFHFSYSEIEWHPIHANVSYLGSENILYKSIDGGINFDTLYTFEGSVRRFEISRDDPNSIYAIINVSYWVWKIFKSTDGGYTFIELPTPPYASGSWRNLSLTLNPFDKNELWVASNSSSNGNKIFSSTNGGTSWTNHYSSVISDENIKDLIYHASDAGDVIYALTNSRFFYYDKTPGTWHTYDEGLPALHTGFKILPFYRDEKIRMATSKGIWEAPTLRPNKIQLMPYVQQDTIYCQRDTISLECHSIINHEGVAWNWTISPMPLFISDANIRNPKIVLGQEGSYSIILTIDQGGIVHTDTFENLIYSFQNCSPDTIPGHTLKTFDNGDYLVAQDANLSDISHFTVTGWWKPDGGQQGFAALFSSGDWCAHCDYTEGLIVSYFGDKLWYKWPGNAANWGGNSGITIPLDEWSYVALVIEPHQATLYLNEEKFVHSIELSPGEFNNIYVGYGHYSKSFQGEIDEVTLWRRALNQDEIRLLRHITKEDAIQSDPDLIAYYQFNNLIQEQIILDKANSHHGHLVNTATIVPSTVPVGRGASAKADAIGPGELQFPGTGIAITLPSTGPYPDGELVVTRINQLPDSIPYGGASDHVYYVINNYGNNQTFNSIVALSIVDLGFSCIQPENVELLSRNENEHLNTWQIVDTEGDSLDMINKAIIFDQNLSITSGGQFIFSRDFVWTGEVDTDWENPLNWSTQIVPNAASHVLIPKNKVNYPVVDENVTIKTLHVEVNAQLYVQDGILFDVLSN